MISVYLLIAIICAVLLIITVALGGFAGDFDVSGDFDIEGPDIDMGGPDVDMGYGDFTGPGISPLSLPIVLAFGTTFGGIGALLEQLDVNTYVIPLIAMTVSIAIAGAMYVAVVKVFVKTQTSSIVNPRDLLGREGTVSVAIKPGRIGQVVIVTDERGRTLLPAIADEPIPTDATVRIAALVGNSVKVERQ
ncbi:MAG: NfeD family protein [Thermoplasmata archaeon]